MDHTADTTAIPTHHDMQRIEAEARRLRAQAVRDMGAALVAAVRGLFAAAPKTGRTA